MTTPLFGQKKAILAWYKISFDFILGFAIHLCQGRIQGGVRGVRVRYFGKKQYN